MKIHITGRHIRLTKALRAYIEKKLSKTQKYMKQIVWAQVLISVEKRFHQCEIVLHAAKQTFRSLAKAADLYAAVDLASDKIDAQLRKYKERLKDKHKIQRSIPEALPSEPLEPMIRFSVIKKLAMPPMSPEKAAREMEDMGYDFWMFRDDKSKQVSVIFRRVDDSLGLLLPAASQKGRK